MIDTHCHLLPGLDDGPETPHEAVELARLLVVDGVRSVLCTPHYSRRFPTRHDDALACHRALQEDVAAAGLALETAVAAEVSPAFAVSAPLDELTLRSIGGRFLLVEVLPESPAALFETITDRLAERRLSPIFGHPERSRAVQRQAASLDLVRRDGALVQIVAPSLLGRWGRRVEAAAMTLLDGGLVDLLGSDAHRVERRTVHLGEAGRLVERHFGTDARAELTVHRPARVLRALHAA